MTSKTAMARGFKSWCEQTSIQQRRQLGLKPTDPIDAFQLAEAVGVSVWTADEVPGFEPECLKTLTVDDPSSWSAVTLTAGAITLTILNPTHSPGRRASNLTHEISHILIGHKPARIDISEDGLLVLNTFDKKQEEEADWLAGCLLLPREALVRLRRANTELAVIERTYGVSSAMLRFRLNVTGADQQVRRARGRM